MPEAADEAVLRREVYQPITAQIADIPLGRRIRRRWWLALAASGVLVAVFVWAVAWLLIAGVGIWGINIPVNWGLAIINTVWWVGIGHAGTLISALLLLMSQSWRNALNRFAEAMTLFAVMMAALFPILHLGRPENFLWMFPIPWTVGVWPQFRSPLTWDVTSFMSYLLVSLVFWYIGLIPDLATLRDRARTPLKRRIYGFFALGWRGSAIHWARWRQAYTAIAAIAFVLVISVHSGVAMLFSASQVPGWHTSIFPPYFVFGAVFSGFAVVILLSVTFRAAFDLRHLITPDHLDVLGRMLLATGLLTLYGYVFETFHAWYSGEPREIHTLLERLAGPYAWSYWGAVALNFAPLQLLWWRGLRRAPLVLALVAAAVTVGMWLERYMIVVTGLYRDFLPSSWGTYSAPLSEWALLAGTVGVFLFLFVLFARFLPLMSMFELKEAEAEERRESPRRTRWPCWRPFPTPNRWWRRRGGRARPATPASTATAPIP